MRQGDERKMEGFSIGFEQNSVIQSENAVTYALFSSKSWK